MRNKLIVWFFGIISFVWALTGEEILQKVDANMIFDSRFTNAEMRIHNPDSERVKKMEVYSQGWNTAFITFIFPPRDAGTRYLKKEGNLWMYLPTTAKTIKLSGHMLRQSVMGSDLSYEDMTDSATLQQSYNSSLLRTELISSRNCWVLELTAKDKSITYPKRVVWIDQEYFIPLKEELFALGGKLLKVLEYKNIQKYEDGRVYPALLVMRNKLQSGSYTELIMKDIKFKIPLQEGIFTLKNLEK